MGRYKKRTAGPLHPAVQALKDRRKELGISQRQMIDKSWLGQSTICELENGKVSPNLITLQQYADVLGGKITITFE